MDAVRRGHFFLQAEDGIRDHCVAGVQTCALPISRGRQGSRAGAVGDAVGPTLYYGAGAGALPTASAVVADLVDEIGRAACRERGWVEGGVVSVRRIEVGL